MRILPVILCLLGAAPACLTATPPASVRFSVFNCSLNRTDLGTTLVAALQAPASSGGLKAKKVAEIIQRVRPDVLLLNEFDYDELAVEPNTAPTLFHSNYLGVSQGGQAAISYAYRYTAVPNTGYNSGFDLDNNGSVDTTEGDEPYGNDCFGFGRWKGQYGMVVYSQFPIDVAKVRTFRLFLWKTMPGAVFPDNAATPATPADWYSNTEKNFFRLSSKSHWDLPITIGGETVHFLVHHPTPPSFDGAEDRNGRRNHDEIRLWADYIEPTRATYIKDDANVTGGLKADDRFVIAGDHNADPFDGDSYDHAIRQLTAHALIDTSFTPSSLGGPQQAIGGVNPAHIGNPAYDTSDFNDSSPGNLRVDYVLPSKSGFSMLGGGVFWPLSSDPTFSLVGISDHRMVHVDLAIEPIIPRVVKNLAIARTGPDISLTWVAAEGYSYLIQHSTTMAGPWIDAPELIISIHPTTFAASVTDPSPAPGRKFYRVKVGFAGP